MVLYGCPFPRVDAAIRIVSPGGQVTEMFLENVTVTNFSNGNAVKITGTRDRSYVFTKKSIGKHRKGGV